MKGGNNIMMFADMVIEFTYFTMRILYNIVKYFSIAIIKLVKYIIRQVKKNRIKKNLKKGKWELIKDSEGKLLLYIGGLKDE